MFRWESSYKRRPVFWRAFKGRIEKKIEPDFHHCIENKPSFKISTEEFYRLASDIVQLFPKESIVVYISAKDGAAKKNASGKLYESYITRRRKLRQIGELAHTYRQSCSSSTTTTDDIPTLDT